MYGCLFSGLMCVGVSKNCGVWRLCDGRVRMKIYLFGLNLFDVSRCSWCVKFLCCVLYYWRLYYFLFAVTLNICWINFIWLLREWNLFYHGVLVGVVFNPICCVVVFVFGGTFFLRINFMCYKRAKALMLFIRIIYITNCNYGLY